MDYIDKINKIDSQISSNNRTTMTKNEYKNVSILCLKSFLLVMLGFTLVDFFWENNKSIYISMGLGFFFTISGNILIYFFEKKHFDLKKRFKYFPNIWGIFYSPFTFCFFPYFTYLKFRKKDSKKAKSVGVLEKEKEQLLLDIKRDHLFLQGILTKKNTTRKEKKFIKEYINPIIFKENNLSVEELKKELYLKNLETKNVKNKIINE